MSVSRRNALLSLLTGGGALIIMPEKWSRPLVNQVILPAHAQTSSTACSGFEVEPIDQAIDITVTESEIRGPIIAARAASNTFNDTQVLQNGMCSNGSVFTQEVTFSGTIDSTTNEISGDLLIRQFCGSDLFCEQVSVYTATQVPTDSSTDLGNYQGRVTGTQTCCRDFF